MKLSKVIERLVAAKKHYGEKDPELWVVISERPKVPGDLALVTSVGPTPFLDGDLCTIGISSDEKANNERCPLCGGILLDRVHMGPICSNGGCDYEVCW